MVMVDTNQSPWLRCFHCGEAGHAVSNCPSHLAGAPRNSAGEETYKAYVSRRREYRGSREWQKRRADNAPEVEQRLEKVAGWMAAINIAGGAENNADAIGTGVDAEARLPMDPIVALVRPSSLNSINITASINDDLTSSQRDRDLRNAAAKYVGHAYRDHFHRCATSVTERLAARFGISAEQGEGESRAGQAEWQEELTRAVREGTPADFSDRAAGGCDDNDDNGDGHGDGSPALSLRAYAVGKLATRVRYLHHLILDDNPLSAVVREVLLPVLPGCGQGRNNEPLRVCSVGGGPAYDHVALTLVARFLARVQGGQSAGTRRWDPRKIDTQVFDLYDEDWRPIADAVVECYAETWANEETFDEGDPSKDGGLVTMHHADIRFGLDESSNGDSLRPAVEKADIICFQFVLHENALLLSAERENGRIGGAIADILDRAAIGTLVICTDSSNTLWPVLKETATECGWIFYSDTERGSRIFLGPASFVILQRTEVKSLM